MKVVIFCGGLGMRLRDYSASIPKPLVHIGDRPILWHLMKYYAHFGHKDFILCLGWNGQIIRDYFEDSSSRIAASLFGKQARRDRDELEADIADWNITFAETGLDTNVGGRLKAVEPYLDGEKLFLANYADGLTDLELPTMIERFETDDSVGMFVSVRPHYLSFHAVSSAENGRVSRIEPANEAGIWMNGGFFVFTPEIFEYIRNGEELVEEPFDRLIGENRLSTMRYDGFWGCMDTFKDKQNLEDLDDDGLAPWKVWQTD